jgi:alkylation response protein AidB-like acyl-CoA dehydrogenase
MDDRAKTDCVANARALAPVILAAAPRIEVNRELPLDLVAALHEARLFRMLVPRSLGGEELSPVEYVQAIEEIAKADASTAWCIAQTSVCSGRGDIQKEPARRLNLGSVGQKRESGRREGRLSCDRHLAVRQRQPARHVARRA